MVDNQHKKISGYRDLSTEEIALMNRIKVKEQELAELMDGLFVNSKSASAKRWVSMARTHLETGVMFAVKSVARPLNGLGDLG